MISHILALVHDITNITEFFYLHQMLLLHNILMFNNFVQVNLLGELCQANPPGELLLGESGYVARFDPVHIYMLLFHNICPAHLLEVYERVTY